MGKLEALAQQDIRLAAQANGAVLWRNNVGACQEASGRYVRFGLANDSAQMNKVIKSSDLIGIQAVTITPDMVGQTVGVFISVEVKRGGWSYKGTAREVAQDHWLQVIKNNGGIGTFATCPADVWGDK